MKKISAIFSVKFCILGMISLLTTSNTVMANDVFSGFYTGASIGGSFLSGQEDHLIQHSEPAPDNSFAVPSKNGIRKNSFLGTIFLGYGNYFINNNVYLGAEVFLDWADRDTNTFESAMNRVSTIFTACTRIKIHPLGSGIDFRPGFNITDFSLLYARLGMGIYKVTLKTDAVDTISVGGVRTPYTINNIKSKTITALRLGAGLEQELCEHVTLRVDYIYTFLGKHALLTTNGATAGGVTASTTTNSTVNLVNQAVMLGLSWHW